MKQLSTSDIRRYFLNFFADRGHKIVHSASLVPGNDPTLLFTNAGMVPFKEIFIGAEQRDYQRAVSSQRCVRAGGKHNDLENVGYTARHHTFFEMLGNFSFGDYFKTQAIPFAWELLTQQFEIPEEKLWVTVYHEDDEAYAIWRDIVGIPDARIIRIGDKPGKGKYESDNFWTMGDTGPCGPCSEIFYDHGPTVQGGPPGSSEEDGDRFIEIWNIVFMQFERDASGNMAPLPKPSIDTGMGLERIAAVLQGVHSNYDIDLFRQLITAAAQITGTSNLAHNSLKVLADHIRATAFLIVDGVLPGNDGRSYVLRRIMRRAIRHGYKLGKTQPFFHQLVSPLVVEMGDAYPELVTRAAQITDIILKEEVRFAQTLETGMQLLEKDIAALSGTEISGETIFKLYDTYGFPVDLTADIARERQLTLDMSGYEKAMDIQRQRAKTAGKFNAEKQYSVQGKSEFYGYTHQETVAHIRYIFVDKQAQDSLTTQSEAVLVLDKTPFYSESGGQVGDTGEIRGTDGVFRVDDTQRQGDVILHFGQLIRGTIACGDRVNAAIDIARREQIRRHHSATHLLHKALQVVLGAHVQQKGSLVDSTKTRFDFSHDAVLSPDQITQIEQQVNTQILANTPVSICEMPYDTALAKGAMALFGEKYGDVVRVVSMGENDYSIELCGGTHVTRTGDIGLLKIISQSAVSAGVRRIECVAGLAALMVMQENARLLQHLATQLKTDSSQLSERIDSLQKQLKTSEIALQQARRELATGSAITESPTAINGWTALIIRRDGFSTDTLRDSAEQLGDKHHADIVVIGGIESDTARLVVRVANSAIAQLNAGDIVRQLAVYIDGRGGGRPNFAQAGGKNMAGLDTALTALNRILPIK